VNVGKIEKASLNKECFIYLSVKIKKTADYQRLFSLLGRD
jgi:hypothetical protein